MYVIIKTIYFDTEVENNIKCYYITQEIGLYLLL